MTIKGIKIFLAVLLVLALGVFVVFSFIYTDPTIGAAMLTHERTDYFWLMFAFMIFFMLLQIPIWMIAFKRAGEGPEAPGRFFSCPLIYVGLLMVIMHWGFMFGLLTKYNEHFGWVVVGGRSMFDSPFAKIEGNMRNAWICTIGVLVGGLILLAIAEIVTRIIKHHFAERDRIEAERVAEMRAEAQRENEARRAMLAENERDRKEKILAIHERAAEVTAERERQAEERAAKKAEELERIRNGTADEGEQRIDWSQYRRI